MEGAGNTVLPQRQSEVMEAGVAAAGFGSGGVKRKRGRPRKQSEAALAEHQNKRGRGRPRGSGKWQTLAASLGGSIGDTAATDFTPCILSIQGGENIVQRIWSFSQRVPESICILSAAGTISGAEIYVPASHGDIIRYEGRFSLINLNGSHTYDEKRGGKICLLSVQLANSEGYVYGGAVAGSLIAGGPTQLIIATFRQTLMVRQQPIIRPPIVNQEQVDIAVPPPVQGQRGQLADAEPRAESVTIDSSILNVTSASSPLTSASSPLPPLSVDWKAFEPLIESKSKHSSGLGS